VPVLIWRRAEKKPRRGPIGNNSRAVRQARKKSRPPGYNRRFLRQTAFGLLVVLGVAALWLWWPTMTGMVRSWMRGKGAFLIKEIVVEGNQRTSRKEIIKALGFASRQLIFASDLDKLHARVQALPFVKEARIRRRWPDRLEIRIREHRPVALFYLDRLYLVDEAGTVLAPAPQNETLDYPLISGVTLEQWRRRPWVWQQLLHQAVKVLNLWQKRGWSEKVAQIGLDEVCGLTVFTAPEVWELQLGRRDFSRRLNHWRRVLDFLGPRASAVKYFDCAGKDMVVVGLQQ